MATLRSLAWAMLSLLLALPLSAPAWSAAPDPFGDALARAQAAPSEQEGLADLLAAATWLPYTSPRQAVKQYAALAAATRFGAVADFARYAELRLRFEMGERVQGQMAALGFVTRVWAIGPFANSGDDGLARPAPPEEGFRADAVYPGAVVPVGWQELGGDAETGYVDLGQRLVPSESAVAFAATGFKLLKAETVRIGIAADGGYRLWVDGKPVAERDKDWGGFFARDVIELPLTRGRHTLMIKFASADGPLGFHLRLYRPDGSPLAPEFVQPATVALAAPAAKWPVPTFIGGSAKPPASCRAVVASLVIDRMLRPNDVTQPWSSAFAQMGTRSDCSATDEWLAAEARPERWMAMAGFDRAVALAKEPAIELRRLETLREDPSAEAAATHRKGIEALIAAYPEWLPPRLIFASLLSEEGFDRWAAEERDRLLQEAPEVPALLRAAISDSEKLLRLDEAAARYEQLLALSLPSWSAAETYLASLLTLLPSDEVLEMADAIAERFPRDPATWLGRARLQRAVESSERAPSERYGALLDRALELCRDCPEPRAAKARWLSELGLREKAVALLGEAIVRAPQRPELVRLREHLALDEAAFWRSQVVPDAELLALKAASTSDPDFSTTTLLRQRVIEVFPNGLAATYHREAVWVRSREAAEQWSSFDFGYDPGEQTAKVERVAVFKADGGPREAFEEQEWDASGDSNNMYYSARSHRITIPSVEVGDIVSVEYLLSDISARNIFDGYFGDFWQLGGDEPITSSRYALSLPRGRKLYSAVTGVEGASLAERREGDRTIYDLAVGPLAGIRYETATPGAAEVYPTLLVSTYADWNDLSRWYWSLIREQFALSGEMRTTVAQLVAGKQTTADKVAAIHDFVVRNIRYVGLEFGIHGFKPYRVIDIFQRKFGDCKDTASLMKVMLNEAGIEAHVVLIRTSDLGRVVSGPPSLAIFNHAIAYVPELDLYLDGTAGHNGLRELPSADQNATAVIILDGEGGRPVTTPAQPSSASVRTVAVRATVSADGIASGELSSRQTGLFAPGARSQLEAPDKRLETLSAWYSDLYRGIAISDFTVAPLAPLGAPVETKVSFTGGTWAMRSGSALQLRPVGRDSDISARFAAAARRTQPLDLSQAYRIAEDHDLELPPGRWTSGSPVRYERSSEQLRVVINIEPGPRSLKAHYEFELLAPRIAPAGYPAFRALLAEAEALLDRTYGYELEVAP